MRIEEISTPDYMAGHCHVMALAIHSLYPTWQLKARVGWDDDGEDDDYRVDHVYVVNPQDGSAYDCRGRFGSEEELLGPDLTGGVETQVVDMDQREIDHLVQRGELEPYTAQDISQAAAEFKNAHAGQ